MGDGLLTRDDARPGQKAAYSLTEQAIQLVPVFAQSEPGDVDTALPPIPCGFAPSSSNRAAQVSGLTIWTSCARPTSACPARHADHVSD